ncbi:hypothetical protein DFH09DRAFT_1277375 [Mycena vulgaris]|nr:hypothetical protein DFH09DRAFT_1277375 [Mycena vulgaris]
MSFNPNLPPPKGPKPPGARVNRSWKPLPIPVIPAPLLKTDAYKPDIPIPPPPQSAPAQPEPDFAHTQPRLRREKRSPAEKLHDKFAALEELLKLDLFYSIIPPEPSTIPAGTLTFFLSLSFYTDARTSQCPTSFLSYTTTKQVIQRRQLKILTKRTSCSPPPDEIHHARPFISTWAVRLVAAEARRQVGRATCNDPDDPEDHTRLRENSNGRTGAHIQVGAMASFIISRNRYANGHLAMVLGVWLFACKAHIDIKRVFCRFSYSVSDTTVRNALNSMTTASLEELRAVVKAATDRGETDGSLVLDNIQDYRELWEQGIGRQTELVQGCAGTWIQNLDCAPGAFDAKPYYDKVALQERKSLTTDDLFDDIDWSYHVSTVSSGITLSSGTPIAIHRMREDRPKAKCQPLPTNSHHPGELPEMVQAVGDYDRTVGINSAKPGKSLHLGTYSRPTETFKNKISTPEIWHTGATEVNSTSANHYGPATSSDPSPLSKCSSAAGFKRPSNMKSCDYYPTVRNLTLIGRRTFWTVGGNVSSLLFNVEMLNFYHRVFFEAEDLDEYFDDLAAKGELPDLSTLLRHAIALVDHYATQSAIQNSLTAEDSTNPDRSNRVPEGSTWVAQTDTHSRADDDDASDLPGLVDIVEPETPRNTTIPLKDSDDAPKVHEEKLDFTGDRVLRNGQIFMQDFGWFIEFAHAVPEGDIGRVWQIMKIWIFKLAGSSHANYVNYLLEVYCMLRYEASQELRNAILNNWPVNIKGELGHWMPVDQHQEHYNLWLQQMRKKHGGEFGDPFYRQTISPNVHHFLQIKEEVETAFDLKCRGQTHTSPHQRDELKLLLKLFKDEEVHLFRCGRSLGHAAVNQFARGWRRLEEEKMAAFLTKSTVLGDFLKEICRIEEGDTAADEDVLMQSDSPIPMTPTPTSSPPIPSSPMPSIRGGASTDEGSRAPSVRSMRSSCSSSIHSLAYIDPNEPEDDGEDLRDAHLTSIQSIGMTLDPWSGLLVLADYEEEDESGDEEEVDEEPEDESEEGSKEEHEEISEQDEGNNR